jgi:predicted alpha/beta-hydrolase family hydrolase
MGRGIGVTVADTAAPDHGPTVPVADGTLASRMAIRVFLGHGASGDASSMAPYVEGLRERGIDAYALQLPKRRAEDAVAALVGQAPRGPDVVIGGHSYGGRVASLAAAEGGYGGLVCLSYPLHRPGAPEIGARVAHWPSIGCPVLLLSGESDPFARIDLLRAAVPGIPQAELVTYPRLGHTLKPVIGDVLDRIATFVEALDPASG